MVKENRKGKETISSRLDRIETLLEGIISMGQQPQGTQNQQNQNCNNEEVLVQKFKSVKPSLEKPGKRQKNVANASADRKINLGVLQNSNRDKKGIPVFFSCGKNHWGICRTTTGRCFGCGSTDHQIRNCSKPPKRVKRSSSNPVTSETAKNAAP